MIPTFTELIHTAGWADRTFATGTLLSNGNIILVAGSGGSTYYNDCWESTDGGTTWTRLTASASFAKRTMLYGVGLSDGSAVIAGGKYYNGFAWVYYNDVWITTDGGTNWSQQTASAGWAARFSHGSVSLSDDSIVVIAGLGGASGTTYLSDVWRSTDAGANWTQQTASASFGTRSAFACVVMPDDSIVIMGGQNYSSGYVYLNDTWRSTDNGASWTRQSASAGWERRHNARAAVLTDGTILIWGGTYGTTHQTDMWKSTDYGVTWTLVTATAGWGCRTACIPIRLSSNMVVAVGGQGATNDEKSAWSFGFLPPTAPTVPPVPTSPIPAVSGGRLSNQVDGSITYQLNSSTSSEDAGSQYDHLMALQAITNYDLRTRP